MGSDGFFDSFIFIDIGILIFKFHQRRHGIFVKFFPPFISKKREGARQDFNEKEPDKKTEKRIDEKTE
jgi:hypothetical protein